MRHESEGKGLHTWTGQLWFVLVTVSRSCYHKHISGIRFVHLQSFWPQEGNPAAVGALLASSEALLPAQLDRAFAAKRRARARGTAMASRTWFPSPSAWLAGAAPDADPSAAFGQEV